MLTPQYYDKLTAELIKLYSDLDNAIISDIVRRLLKAGDVTDTARWQIQQLQESGMLYNDILSEISRLTDATQKQVRDLFEDAGIQAIKNDNVRYHAAGLEGIIKMSDAALQVLNAGYEKCSGNLSNLTLTTANTSQQAYITACNNAYMQITSGAFDYNTAIRNAVKAAASEGTEVLYPSGHRDKLDVAVRRAVLTGIGQTCRTLSETNAQDLGCDLMEITAHAGARPSHAEWQGQIVSLSGRKGYLSKDDIGYGTGDGFGGWNCRHDWHPFFEGISSRAYDDAELKKLNERNIEYNGEKYTEYEISQMQRKFERDIRKLKREAVAADTGRTNAQNDKLKQQFDDDFTVVSVKLKEKERQLNDFLKQTGELPDNARTQAMGFGRSVSQKAVVANKNMLQYLDKDDIINVRKILSGYNAYIGKYPDSEFKYYMIDYKLKQAGIKKGIVLPPRPKRAFILPDNKAKNDQYHIMHRMVERYITDDDLEKFMKESKVMFAQWNGVRRLFYTEKGAVIITKSDTGWIYKTAWSKSDFDDEALKILEVINRYA